MKVAVLGGTGFLGSKICSAVTRRNWLAVPIDSRKKHNLLEADAVVHSIGAIMPDPRYKRLISQPISLSSMANLVKMRLGLDPPSPMSRDKASLEYLNFETARAAALQLRGKVSDASPIPDSERVPFIYISADDWSRLASPQYIATKRQAESFLQSLPYLRSVFLRPGFISPDPPASCSTATPRHIVDRALALTNAGIRMNAQAVAEAVCDAIEDSNIEGVISRDALKAFEQL